MLVKIDLYLPLTCSHPSNDVSATLTRQSKAWENAGVSSVPVRLFIVVSSSSRKCDRYMNGAIPQDNLIDRYMLNINKHMSFDRPRAGCFSFSVGSA